jgi:hypothetical protein
METKRCAAPYGRQRFIAAASTLLWSYLDLAIALPLALAATPRDGVSCGAGDVLNALATKKVQG